MNDDEDLWSTVVPQTSRADRGDIRRAADPSVNPQLGVNGCRTLYEAFRYGQAINPMGPCMGFRAVSTNGFATPFIYSSYTECLARIDCFGAGLERLNLVQKNEDGIMVVSQFVKANELLPCSSHLCFFGETLDPYPLPLFRTAFLRSPCT
jgi:long-chain acyl-CoA synthetase